MLVVNAPILERSYHTWPSLNDLNAEKTLDLNPKFWGKDVKCKPVLKFVVAFWSSDREKIFQDFILRRLSSKQGDGKWCLPCLPTLIDNLCTVGIVDKHLTDFFFHSLKTLFHRESGFEGIQELWAFVGDSDDDSSSNSFSESIPFLHASSTPLGDSSSCVSFSLSHSLKSVIENPSPHNRIYNMNSGCLNLISNNEGYT